MYAAGGFVEEVIAGNRAEFPTSGVTKKIRRKRKRI